MTAPIRDDVALALNFAPVAFREAFRTVFALDAALGAMAAAAREPQLGAIRLAWWRDQLAALASGPEPSDPLLKQCLEIVRHRRVPGESLADIAEGWSLTLPPGLEDAAGIEHYARLRGDGIETALARCSGLESSGRAGRAFVLADLLGPSDDETGREAVREAIATLPKTVYPGALRPLALLAHWARVDAERAAASEDRMTLRRKALSALLFTLRRPSV